MERKMLILRPGLSPRASSTTSITRPSAGETIKSGSDGLVLSGAPEKNSTNAPSTSSTAPSQFQCNPSATNANNNGAAANLYPSLTMRFLGGRKNATLVLSSPPFYLNLPLRRCAYRLGAARKR